MRNYRSAGSSFYGAGEAKCTNENACRPDCCLPCCAPPRRCPVSPRRPSNCCTFIPPPGLTTTRYCGDPCSPPPPGCTPRPDRGPFSCARTKGCNPCAPTRRSARPLCRPCPPCPKPFTPCRPCPPSECSISCKPSKCPPRRPWISNFCSPILDACCPSPRRDPCSSPYKYCPPTRRRSKCTPSCSPRRSTSCGSSFCGSPPMPYRRRSCGIKCSRCDCDPCSCCSPKSCCSSDDIDKCSEDASKGPTSWFLKRTGKLGTCKSPVDPHFCPWEADVTVTGTVRGHCTSTAVEVAKRLTGKFLSRGQRYTYKESPSNSGSCGSKRNQKMTLGFLDDGTKLDFIRKKSDEDDDAAVQSFTNNATSNAYSSPPHPKSWRFFGSGGYLEVKEAKRSSKGDLTWATAYIHDGDEERANMGLTNNSLNRKDSVGRISRRSWSERGARRRSHSKARSRAASVGSDSDQSYLTAPESSANEQNIALNRRPFRHGGDSDKKKRSRSRKRSTQSQRRSYNVSSDEDQFVQVCYSDENESDAASRDNLEGDYAFNNDDDSDFGDTRLSSHEQSMADRCARNEERRHTPYLTYSNRADRSSHGNAHRRKNSRPPRSSDNAVYSPHPQSYYDHGQSSEDEWRNSKSSQLKSSHFINNAKREGRRSSHSKHLNRKKRVTYDDDL